MKNEVTLEAANLLQQALHSDTGKVKYWLSQTTPQLEAILLAHGLACAGTAPRPGEPDGEPYWGVWRLDDRAKAVEAALPFRTAEQPIAFTLTKIPHESARKVYTCPKCRSEDVHFHDGDSVSIPVLPNGIDDYNDVDAAIMVGECRACKHPVYFVEFGFTNVTNPDDDDPFVVDNLSQKPDAFDVYRAEAAGMDPWMVSRMWYTTGQQHDKAAPPRLPKGPFVVDFHQFGAFSLDRRGELSGPNGVARCASTNSKWADAETLFRNLAGNAMAALLAAAADKTNA